MLCKTFGFWLLLVGIPALLCFKPVPVFSFAFGYGFGVAFAFAGAAATGAGAVLVAPLPLVFPTVVLDHVVERLLVVPLLYLEHVHRDTAKTSH